jgi:hypothetical protein
MNGQPQDFYSSPHEPASGSGKGGKHLSSATPLASNVDSLIRFMHMNHAPHKISPMPGVPKLLNLMVGTQGTYPGVRRGVVWFILRSDQGSTKCGLDKQP